jgi:hypothetical protein
MPFRKLAAAALLALASAAAQAPLPTLRIEPTAGGSVLYIKNTYTQPLAAYMIEMPDYPGSYYVLFSDVLDAQPIAPGAELRRPITNMTVGAVPDAVKMQAAAYTDGATAGAPEKVSAIIERRKATLATIRECIARLEKGASGADLKQWSDGLPPIPRNRTRSQDAFNQAEIRSVIGKTTARLSSEGAEKTLAQLREIERMLAAAKP